MRAVAQRVTSARVSVDGVVVSEIGPGFLLLVGVARDDTEADAEVLAAKVAALRVFPDAEERMNLALADVGGAVLVVSQFTLLADVRKGKRPSFAAAADPGCAATLVDLVAASIREAGIRCVTGRFGARMFVELVNDGPVTIVIDTGEGRVL